MHSRAGTALIRRDGSKTKIRGMLVVALSTAAVAVASLLSIACGGGEEASPGSPGLGDPLYPGLGNGGYEVSHYTVTLDVDVDRNFVSGKAIIEANATQALSSFNLDLRGLGVLETRVSGQTANHTRSGNELTIEPEGPIRNGESFTVEILYVGQPTPDEIPGIGFRGGWIRYPTGIYAAGEPWGSSHLVSCE